MRIRAIFLDRDGVINRLILNPLTNEYESPHHPDDFELYPDLVNSLKKLQNEGFKLFTVSNQPSYAKGKISLENIYKIHEKFHQQMISNNVIFQEYFYCYHHPKGIVPEYSFDCECRKPKPYFIKKAIEKYSLTPALSWMIGDRDTDIFCGQASGVKTISIEEENSKVYRGKSIPDFSAQNLNEAVEFILNIELKKINNNIK